MKDCFGMQLGFFREGMVPEIEEREKCLNCEDFDRCFKYSLVLAIHNLRYEIRTGVRGIRNSLGGSHSDFPFW